MGIYAKLIEKDWKHLKCDTGEEYVGKREKQKTKYLLQIVDEGKYILIENIENRRRKLWDT